MASKGREMSETNNNSKRMKGSIKKSYFDVVGLCCSSEVPLIEKILKSLEGVIEISVIVPTRTVIVVHDTLLISELEIVKALNKARLEANVRVKGKTNYRGKWPSPYVILSGLLLLLSLIKFVYHPFQWLAVAAVAVGILPILMRCVIAIKNFTLDANILMFVAVIGTLVMRDYLEAGTIVFLFTVSEWLGMRASYKATAVMSTLMSMAPPKATIAESGEIVNVEDVKLNTVLAVKAGEIIPIDGVVVDGSCEVDEKTLTGESYPVAKQKDSIVWAGTVNVNGYVNVKTTALAEDCAVAKMARLVEEAQNKKSSVQRLIDKCAKYYTPAVVLISGGLVLIPVILKFRNLRHWFHLGLVVLVSACPCGLILSTPVATFCALSKAATAGLLIKGGDYLEILAKLKFIAFDKTGTLTRGEFTVEDFHSIVDDVSLSNLLYWVSSIEGKSGHPIAAVLVEYASSKSVKPSPESVEDFGDFPGEGVSGKIDGKHIFVGNRKLAQRAGCITPSNSGGNTKEGRTSGYIYCEGVLLGTFNLSDNCRIGAKEALRELKSMGIKTALLTGDGQSAALHTHEQLGHVLDVVHAELLPEDKARIIEECKEEGVTAMVGDGVNDAPALVTADIGISMGVSGSALANETSHVVLMSNDIRKIPSAIKLARKARWKVIQNIVFSIATKVGVLALAFAGHPLVWLAVVADVVTCLIVILNSMLLLHGGSHGHGKNNKCNSHKNKCNSSTSHYHNHSNKLNNDSRCSKKIIPPKASCDSAECGSQSCSTTPCHVNKCVDKESGHHHKHDMESHDHHSHDKPCSIIDDASLQCGGHECESTTSHHTSTTCEGTTPCSVFETCNPSYCDENHCLDMVESQSCCVEDGKPNEGVTCCGDDICASNQHKETLLECGQEHSKEDSSESTKSEHHVMIDGEHHEQKTCCDDYDVDDDDGISLVDKPQKKKGGSRCHSHKPHDHDHGHHHHHAHHRHHHVVSHACSSLRKRGVSACCMTYNKKCCGSAHPHFVGGAGFRGLTEIITE